MIHAGKVFQTDCNPIPQVWKEKQMKLFFFFASSIVVLYDGLPAQLRGRAGSLGLSCHYLGETTLKMQIGDGACMATWTLDLE